MDKNVIVIGNTLDETFNYVMSISKDIRMASFRMRRVEADGCIYRIFSMAGQGWYNSLRGCRASEVWVDIKLYLDEDIINSLIQTATYRIENIYLYDSYNIREYK